MENTDGVTPEVQVVAVADALAWEASLDPELFDPAAADIASGEDQNLDEALKYRDMAEREDPASRLALMTFEERIDLVERAVKRNPLHREVLYKTLKYCMERRLLPDVEESIASYPEFPSTAQSPYYLLHFLVKDGGIDVFELDEEGEVVTEERKEGLTEDEIDDLVAQYAYQTNDIGAVIVEKMSPKNRLIELLGIVPDYYDTYIEVLGFLEEKKTFASVDTLLRGRDVLMANRDPGDRPIQPSVFIDKLEKAGGIYWDGGWLITPEGKELLETLQERNEA